MKPKLLVLFLLMCSMSKMANARHTLLFDRIPQEADVELLMMSNETLSKMKGEIFNVDVIGYGTVGLYTHSKSHDGLSITERYQPLCNYDELEGVKVYFNKVNPQSIFYLGEGSMIVAAAGSKSLPIASYNKLYKKKYRDIVFAHLISPENKFLKDLKLQKPERKFMIGDKVQLKFIYNTNISEEDLELSFNLNGVEYEVKESGVVDIRLDQNVNTINYSVRSKTCNCNYPVQPETIMAKTCDTKFPILLDMHYDSFLNSNEGEKINNVERWQVSDNYIFNDSLQKYDIGYCYVIPVHFECPISEFKVFLWNGDGEMETNPLVQQVSRMNVERAPMIDLNAPFNSSVGDWTYSKVGRELFKAVYKAPIPDDVEFILFKPEGDLGQFFKLSFIPEGVTNVKWQFPPFDIGFTSCEKN
jgi:hypothetical protein